MKKPEQPVFLASQGVIQYRNDRLRPVSDPSE